MYMTNRNDKGGELLGQELRRRWSPEQKLAMVRESLQPGQSVSVAARQNGVNANRRSPFHSGRSWSPQPPVCLTSVIEQGRSTG
jgi:transposase